MDLSKSNCSRAAAFPISRDPPEGGTDDPTIKHEVEAVGFPISRDPPEGGTLSIINGGTGSNTKCFQFLGIPPKGELDFLLEVHPELVKMFPISRDPPEGGTGVPAPKVRVNHAVSNF